MARPTLMQIPKQHPPLIPPHGAIPAGRTMDNQHQLYTLTRRRTKSVPQLNPDGTTIWKIHRTTGEPLWPMRQRQAYDEVLLFYLESPGNNNVTMAQYTLPTEAELAERLRNEKIAALMPAMAGVFVDQGLTPDTIAAWLRGGVTSQQAEAEIADDAVLEEVASTAPTFPHVLEDGRWLFSDGSASSKKTPMGEVEARATEAKIEAERAARRKEMAEAPTH